MYAYAPNGTVVRTGDLPTSWNLKDGRSVSGFNLWSDAEVKPEGWLPVVEQRATLAADQHHAAPTFTVRANDVLAVYAAEDDAPAAVNDRTIRSQAAAALTANRTYVALANPTAAQTTAQVKALSRQVNSLLRQMLGQLDGTD